MGFTVVRNASDTQLIRSPDVSEDRGRRALRNPADGYNDRSAMTCLYRGSWPSPTNQDCFTP